jgi:transcriptional regulator with XRE-family HTH domain
MDMTLPEWIDQDAFALEVAQEETLLDATEELYKALEEMGITKTELAEKLNKKPAFISKLFRGSHNPTLKTLAEVAHALDKKVRIKLVDDSSTMNWLNGDFDRTITTVKTQKIYQNTTHSHKVCVGEWS